MLFVFTNVNSIVSGTPNATFAVLRLVRISLRTIPEQFRTFSAWLDAFEPSARYGPAVSCGISSTQTVGAVVGVVVAIAACTAL